MSNTNSNEAILVAGATGLLGIEICRQLKEKGKMVKGLVRKTSDAGKLGQLRALGIETLEGDVKNRSSLDRAVQGASSVISTISSTSSRQDGDTIESVDDEGQINLIDAARDAGVKHFIYISFCPMPDEFPLQNAKRKIEEHLKKSGLNYTILRPTFFMEVWLSPPLGFDHVNAKATIYGAGKNKCSWISFKDVASFAVRSLDVGAANNETFDLGGPESLSPLEVVNIFEENNGKQFELQFVPEEGLSQQKKTAQDALHQSFASLMFALAKGSEIDMGHTRAIFSLQELTSVAEYAKSIKVEMLDA